MTTSPVLAFQPAQGRAVGVKSGKDDGEALPGFGEMLRDAPSARDKPGKDGADAGVRWARFAEKLDRTAVAADGPAVGDRTGEVTSEDPDETARPDGFRTDFPDTFRTNPPDGFRDAGVVLAPPPFARPFAQTGPRSEAATAQASSRKPLQSRDFPDAASSDKLDAVDSEPDATGSRAPIARSNPSPEPSSNRIFAPDAFSAPIFPGSVDENTSVKEATDGGAAAPEAPSSRSTPPVNVLSRQDFPAPAQTTVASLTQSLAADETFAQAMSKTHPVNHSHGGATVPAHTLKIELHPAELGAVTASLRMAGEQLSIELKVETAEAHRRLSVDSEAIVSSLRGLGYDRHAANQEGNSDAENLRQPGVGCKHHDLPRIPGG